jgi:2'-5' RNA ligase
MSAPQAHLRTAAPSGNWFVALRFTGADDLVARLPAPPPGTGLLHTEDLHVTIAFLGNAGEARVRAGFAALEWRVGPVEATLGALVAMGAPNRFSALSALLDGGRSAIEAEIDRARPPIFEAAGAPPETRPAKAHLTIARVSSRGDRRVAIGWAREIDLGGPTVRFDRAALFTTSSDPRDAISEPRRRYRVIEERVLHVP